METRWNSCLPPGVGSRVNMVLPFIRHQTIFFSKDISLIITLAGLQNLKKGSGCRLIAFSIILSIDDSDLWMINCRIEDE